MRKKKGERESDRFMPYLQISRKRQTVIKGKGEMKWRSNGSETNKNRQKACTEKWRQCNRLREKYREKKGRKGSMTKREIERRVRENREMERK